MWLNINDNKRGPILINLDRVDRIIIIREPNISFEDKCTLVFSGNPNTQYEESFMTRKEADDRFNAIAEKIRG